MAKTKSILEEAIIESRQVREAAIEQAFENLKEDLTPSIKAMLESKLNEEEVELEEEESLEESNSNSGFKEVKLKEAENTEEEPDGDEEGGEANGDHEEPDGDEPAEEEPDGDENGGEAEGNHEEPDGDEPEEMSADDDTKLEDLTLGDLKSLVSDLVSQLQAAPAPEGEMGADMEAGDVEGMGDEEAPLDGEEPNLGDNEPGADAGAGAEGMEDVEAGEGEKDNDEEIDINELLKELADEDSQKESEEGNEELQEALANVRFQLKQANLKNKALSKNLQECKKVLADVNLVNGKLQYVARMLSENSLTKAQKANIITRLDEATSVKEVKSIYNTLTESLKVGGNVLKEHKGTASKATGNSTRVVGYENDATVRRLQQLAGIID